MTIFVASTHLTAAKLADIATKIASCCDGHTILRLSQVLECKEDVTFSPQEIDNIIRKSLSTRCYWIVTHLAKLLFEAKGFTKTVNERSALVSLAYKLQTQ